MQSLLNSVKLANHLFRDNPVNPARGRFFAVLPGDTGVRGPTDCTDQQYTEVQGLLNR